MRYEQNSAAAVCVRCLECSDPPPSRQETGRGSIPWLLPAWETPWASPWQLSPPSPSTATSAPCDVMDPPPHPPRGAHAVDRRGQHPPGFHRQVRSYCTCIVYSSHVASVTWLFFSFRELYFKLASHHHWLCWLMGVVTQPYLAADWMIFSQSDPVVVHMTYISTVFPTLANVTATISIFSNNVL